MPWFKAELLITGNMLHIACLRGAIVDISSITINTFLIAVAKPLGRTLQLQFKNNLWSFFWQSPLKLLSGTGFKKSLYSRIRENKKSTAVMPVDNREVILHWKKMRHHYKLPESKNYHPLLKWLECSSSPWHLGRQSLHLRDWRLYWYFCPWEPGFSKWLREVVRKPGGRWTRGDHFIPCWIVFCFWQNLTLLFSGGITAAPSALAQT